MHAFDGQTDGRTDGQTDGRTEFSSQDRVCIPCSAVKILCKNLHALLNYKKSQVATFYFHPVKKGRQLF